MFVFKKITVSQIDDRISLIIKYKTFNMFVMGDINLDFINVSQFRKIKSDIFLILSN